MKLHGNKAPPSPLTCFYTGRSQGVPYTLNQTSLPCLLEEAMHREWYDLNVICETH